MKRNKQSVQDRFVGLGIWLFLALCTGWTDISGVYAQDVRPDFEMLDSRLPDIDEMNRLQMGNDSVAFSLVLPGQFKLYADNTIKDAYGELDSVWKRLYGMRSGMEQTDTMRVLHVGDSHIRGHIYPRTTGAFFMEDFGPSVYTDLGINGATCQTFTREEQLCKIFNAHPDLIILSFGTNESHNRGYDAHVHYRQMDELVSLIRGRMPDVPILLTTPPGSYERYWVRRRRHYRVNPRTELAAKTIENFAADHKLAVWNMYQVVGGREYACANWQSSRLMNTDRIHYLADGYVLQGSLLYQAIVNAYNTYVAR